MKSDKIIVFLFVFIILLNIVYSENLNIIFNDSVITDLNDNIQIMDYGNINNSIIDFDKNININGNDNFYYLSTDLNLLTTFDSYTSNNWDFMRFGCSGNVPQSQKIIYKFDTPFYLNSESQLFINYSNSYLLNYPRATRKYNDFFYYTFYDINKNPIVMFGQDLGVSSTFYKDSTFIFVNQYLSLNASVNPIYRLNLLNTNNSLTTISAGNFDLLLQNITFNGLNENMYKDYYYFSIDYYKPVQSTVPNCTELLTGILYLQNPSFYEIKLIENITYNRFNTLPYIESITPLNRNIELCDDSVYFNYTINAIDDEKDIIYYSTSEPLLYAQNKIINTYFANYENQICSYDSNFENKYITYQGIDYLRKGLLTGAECKGYVQGFENMSFQYDYGLTGNSTFIIELNYLNSLFGGNDNNITLCFNEDSNQLIECLEFYKHDNNISIYSSNSSLITTLENFKGNSLYINNHDFYKNDSRISLEFLYTNSTNNINYAYYNFTKEFNNIKGFTIKTKDFNRFLGENLQIKNIRFLNTDFIPQLEYTTDNNRSIEFLNLGSQSFKIYLTDEQGIYLNEFNEYDYYINVVPCGTLLNPLNQTQDYNGQTLNIFEGLNEFKAMIKLFFISLDSIFGIEGNFFNIYWAFKTLVMIISVALCIGISAIFIQFGTKITYFIFSVFLTLCYFFNTLLIEYSINFTMIIILNMVIALIQLVALKGGQEV